MCEILVPNNSPIAEAGIPTIWFDYDTIYLELVLTLQGWGLHPEDRPSPNISDANCKSGLSPALVTNQLWVGVSQDLLLRPSNLLKWFTECRASVCGGLGALVAHLCPTLATPWTVARQTPLSMGLSRQEYWSGLPFPSPGDLPDPGIKPRAPALQADSLPTELPGTPSGKSLPISLKCESVSPWVVPDSLPPHGL